MRWLDDINNSTEMSLNKLWEMKDREAWCAVVHGVAEPDRKGVLRESIQKPSFLRELGKSACPSLSQL